ncbi:MAG: 1-acyl-sn-glycerol-3-phosphate acyltransferase [Deinococcus sp.]|nr:1-acyl-sn-glycerol-3-phosphate acyltransferase [Deinococcus sp.]
MFYRVIWLLAFLLCNLLFRLQVRGREHLPRQGPFLLVANHSSYLDPIVIAVSLWRPINFLGHDGLFRIPVLRTILPWLHTMPVRRGEGDVGAIRRSLHILRRGEPLLIFPEGTRSPDGRLRPARPGAAALALRTGVPVVPVGVVGAGRVLPVGGPFRLAKIQVRFGPALDLKTSAAEPSTATLQMMAAISQLLPSELRSLLDP